MITIQEWKTMSGKEQTLWLEKNTESSERDESRIGLVQGVGINDAHYCTKSRVDGKRVVCQAYNTWKSMLKRSYSNKFHEKHETYRGVSVCEEWHSFMPFREWWIDNQGDGLALDKDLLSDAGVYSPETCIFVPAWLNTFTTDRGAARGVYPIGVNFDKRSGKFRSTCSNPIAKKQEYLGLFNTPEAAHLAWRTRKMELALELRPKMDEIDLRIYARVVEIINNAE